KAGGLEIEEAQLWRIRLRLASRPCARQRVEPVAATFDRLHDVADLFPAVGAIGRVVAIDDDDSGGGRLDPLPREHIGDTMPVEARCARMPRRRFCRPLLDAGIG